MEETVSVWDEIGILRQVVQHKLLFVETPDSVESSLALSNYRYLTQHSLARCVRACVR